MPEPLSYMFFEVTAMVCTVEVTRSPSETWNVTSPPVKSASLVTVKFPEASS